MGHIYHISNLSANPLVTRNMGGSKEFSTKTDSFAMSCLTLSGKERAIIVAWADASQQTWLFEGDTAAKYCRFISHLGKSHHADRGCSQCEDSNVSSTSVICPAGIEVPAQRAELSADTRVLPESDLDLMRAIETIGEIQNLRTSKEQSSGV